MRMNSRRAFTLIDCAATIGVVGVAACLLTVSLKRERAQASLGQTMTNLRVIGDAFASYGEDYQDRVLGFSWAPGNCPSQYPDLKVATSAVDAATCQAADIARRRSGNTQFPRISGWIPQVSYWNFVVADYLNLPLPGAAFQSPEHAGLLALASDPANWNTTSVDSRWPLGSSYDVTAGCWGGPDSGTNAISQDGQSYSLLLIPGGWTATARKLSEITYPSAKALVFDRWQWHFGARHGYFMYDEARVPVCTGDGAVWVRAGLQTDDGWRPNTPTNPQPSYISYDATSAAKTAPPLPLSGNASDLVKGQLRYTRGGLAGRDFPPPGGL